MRTREAPTAAQQRYAQAYAAQYAGHDLLDALQAYGEVIATHPDSPEAGYSRTQILGIAKRVVPAEELLASHKALILSHLRPGGRPFAGSGEAMMQDRT
jgi:hypothetical protein